MTQEDKELLLQDLCARLPYGVKVYAGEDLAMALKQIDYECFCEAWENEDFKCHSRWMLPFLRPMSSMTEEEKEELLNLLFDKEAKCFYIDEEGLIDGKTSYLMKEGLNYPAFCPINIVLYTDWLTAHHFDYRGLIEKGLALEATSETYNKNKTK